MGFRSRLLAAVGYIGLGAALTMTASCAAEVGFTPSGERLRSFDAVLTDATTQGYININTRDLAIARPIFDKVIAVTAELYPSSRAIPWQFYLAHLQGLGAYCNGGRVLIYQDLINTLRPSNDEFAAMVAHEVTHCLHDHKLAPGVKFVCAYEYEADLTGVKILRAAGYNVQAMATLIDKTTATAVARWGSMGCDDRAARVRAELAKTGYR